MKKFLVLVAALALFLPMQAALAQQPPGINYVVSITSKSVSGNTATLSGTAFAKYKGQLNQQHFDIDWGDGSPVQNFDAKYVVPANDNDGDLQFNWNESHDFNDGVYTITAVLYHQTPGGAEASATEEVRIAVNVGVLTVIKEVEGSDNSPSSFELQVNGLQVSETFNGSASGVELILAPEMYTVFEGDYENFITSYSGDCDEHGDINILAGEFYSCTVTNTYREPVEDPTQGTLMIIKEIEGSEDVASSFTLTVSGNDNDYEVSFAGSGAPGEELTLDPGGYTVSEESIPSNYTVSFDPESDCDENGNVTVEAGETKTCKVINTYSEEEEKKTTLTVTKKVVGGPKVVSDFPLYVCRVFGDSAYMPMMVVNPQFSTINPDIMNIPCEGLVVSGEVNEFLPGDYAVSEVNEFESVYKTTFSGDCDSEGKVSLELGDNKSCVITNTYVGGGGTGGSSGGGSAGGRAAPPSNPAPEPSDEPSENEGEVLSEEIVNEEEVEDEEEESGEVLSEEACGIYMYEYIHIRKQNNPEEVAKLQMFLNDYMKENLEVSGIYDTLTFNAVKRFQLKEFMEVLEPWGITEPTGYVYITTKRRINMIKCASLDIPIPKWLTPDTNIHDNL